MSAVTTNGTRLLRVVIADDTPDVRLLLRSTLECSGSFSVVAEAADGREAIDMAGLHQPDVVLLDLAMPLLDGFEAIPEILRQAPAARVVVLSGFNADRAADQALALGATAYIEKRHRPDELVRRIVAAVARDAAPPSSVEEAARTARDQFRLVFENAPIGTALLDFDGCFTQVNEAFCRITGRSETDLLDPAVNEIYDLTHHEDIAADRDLLVQLLAGKRPAYQLQKRYVRPDETSVWVLLSRSLMVGGDGRPSRIIAQIIDVTTHQEVEARVAESERQLAQAQRLAQIGSWEWDIAADRLTWSQELFRIYGIDPASFNASYGSYIDRVHAEDRASVAEAVQRASATAEPFETEHRINREDGEVRWVQGRGQVIADDQGQVIRMFGTSQDITERRRSEERLRFLAAELGHANAELARSNADLSQFASVAAHDLKSPLQIIVGYAELLQRLYGELVDERGQQFLDAMLNATRRMDALIEDLLAYCKVGSAERVMESVDLNVLVGEVSALLTRQGDLDAAQISCDPLPTVVADPGQLRQLMQNLLSNALKFTREGVRPEIRVTAERSEDAWLISVADNGIGVDADARERIFGMFERSHSGEYQGTGIGLAICKRIVSRRGGEIWVQTQPGSGSRFSFTLPDVRPDGTKELETAADEPPRRDILLVEDSVDHAALIAALLDEAVAGYRLRRTSSLAEARAALVDHVPDCVLLDLALPDARGLDGLTELRAAAPRTPIVVITSRFDEALALAAVREGAQDYLVKGRIQGETVSRAIGYAIERVALDAEVAHGALHDALTGLANRTLLLDRLHLALARARRGAGAVAVLYMDLDGFKPINDRHGHECGDAVLVALAERLGATVRPQDTVARIGGDEFVVLCEGVSSGPELDALASRLTAAIGEPIVVGDQTVQVGVSIGTAVSEDGTTDAAELLRDADTRMYEAKRAAAS